MNHQKILRVTIGKLILIKIRSQILNAPKAREPILYQEFNSNSQDDLYQSIMPKI